MHSSKGLGLQQKIELVDAEGPDWPEWVSGNYQRDNINYREDEWTWGETWITRMEGAIYMITWMADGYALFQYTHPATLGYGHTIIWQPFVLSPKEKQIPAAMKWVMDTLPARVIIKELSTQQGET